jgi:hypothetical protein
MNLKLTLTKRITIAIGLGLVLARLARAEPTITTHPAPVLDRAAAGVSQ